MGPGIVIPVLLIAIVVPLGWAWAKKLKDPPTSDDEPVTAPSVLLTSNALRQLASPPWRVVYEIADTKMGGIEHVLIGPAGAFAVETSMEPVPAAPTGEPDAHVMARAAIARGGLDDALTGCGLASDRLIRIHWGESATTSVDVMPGVTAVDGREVDNWADSLPADVLTTAQVDLGWQTVLKSIGRPDPLG